MSGSRFTRWSLDGRDWCSGDGRLWVNGRRVGEGRQPHFQHDGTILCAGLETGIVHWVRVMGQATEDNPEGWMPAQDLQPEAPVNGFTANAYGIWAYYTTTGGPQVVCSWGSFPGYADMAVGPNGELALIRHDNGGLVIVRADGKRWLVQPEGAAAPRWHSSGMLAWNDLRDGQVKATFLPWESEMFSFSGAVAPFPIADWQPQHAVCGWVGGVYLTAADERLALADRPGQGVWLPSLHTADLFVDSTARICKVVGWSDALQAVEVHTIPWTSMTQNLRPPVVEPPKPEPPKPEPPKPERPRITIESYEPQEGAAPLDVEVVVRLSGGPATRAELIAYGPEGQELLSTIQREPGLTVVRLALRTPGTWELAAFAKGSGGQDMTGQSRRVQVGAPEPPPVPPQKPPEGAWETITGEAKALALSGEYGAAWGLLRGLGAPPDYAAPLNTEQAWAHLFPGQPYPGTPTPPGPGPDPVQPTPDHPLPADPRRWRGNFLAFPGYPMAFMFPGWPADKRWAFARAYRAAGHTHLPIGIWGAYPGQPTFDFRNDPGGYVRILQELRGHGIEPCVFVHTDAVSGRDPFTRGQLTTWARGYLPHIQHLVRLWCDGWEGNQIDIQWPGFWMGNGTERLAWAINLRGMLGPEAVLYVHFSPERITGWPHYPNHDGPQDEPGWWTRGAKDVYTGILYQRRPDEDERWVLAHTIGGRGADGSVDIGDAARIAGGHWGFQRDFVLFEFARDLDRWQRLVAAVKDHPLIKGWC